MTDLGTDISCVEDLDQTGLVVTSRLMLGQACARRLITPNGGLFDDPNYGYDLTQFVNADIGPGDLDDIQSSINQELSKDERVLDCLSLVTLESDGTMTVVAEIIDSEGPFELVLSVSDITVELLRVS